MGEILFTSEQLAAHLETDQNTLKDLLSAHPEIQTRIQEGSIYYALNTAIIKSLAESLPPRQESEDKTLDSLSKTSQPEQDTNYTTVLMKAIESYIEKLEETYKNKEALAFQLCYLRVPFNLIIETEYDMGKFNDRIKSDLNNAKINVALEILRKTTQAISYEDVTGLEGEEQYKFVDDDFLKKCFGSCGVGMVIVEELNKQSKVEMCSKILDRIETKLGEVLSNYI